MAQKKRHISAQTRVKLSQAAKRRRRGTKGTSLAGKFLSGLMPSRPSFSTIPGPHGTTPSAKKEAGQSNYADADRLVRGNPEGAKREIARARTERQTGSSHVRDTDVTPPSMRVSTGAVRKARDSYRESHWQEPGVYATSERKPPSQFVREEMSSSHQKAFDKLRADPKSNFNAGYDTTPTPSGKGTRGARHGERVYIERLQAGDSHKAAYDFVGEGASPKDERSRAEIEATDFRTSQQKRQRRRKSPGRASKFQDGAPKGKDFLEVGVDAQSAESLDALRERMPDTTDRELLKVQQRQRMDIQAEFEKNLKWAHETKQANLMGDEIGPKGRKSKETDDRVVFFTTNMGSPAPSVPADSLVGQYIIRRRAKMLQEMGYSKNSLRGEFPRAVRDMHIMELSTGLSLGVEGRGGVYNETGFRKGNKPSKGYNKATPLGSQILHDSAGAPIYDSSGNVRYSDGYTRPVNWQSPKVGLKIFIG